MHRMKNYILIVFLCLVLTGFTAAEEILPKTSEPGDGIHLGQAVTFERAGLGLLQHNPLGQYREFSSVGLGFRLGAGFSIPPLGRTVPFLEPMLALFDIGFVFNVTPSEYYNSLTSILWSLGIGYRFPILDILAITPSLHYGGMILALKGNLAGYGIITSTAAYDQLLKIAVEVSEIFPIETSIGIIDFYVTPGYHMFFEQESVGHELTFQLGSRVNF